MVPQAMPKFERTLGPKYAQSVPAAQRSQISGIFQDRRTDGTDSSALTAGRVLSRGGTQEERGEKLRTDV